MQYTLRNIPKPIDRALRAKAKSEGKSLNEVAVEVLGRGLGLNGVPKVYHDLDHWIGRGQGLEPEVLKAIAENDVVHPDDYR